MPSTKRQPPVTPPPAGPAPVPAAASSRWLAAVRAGEQATSLDTLPDLARGLGGATSYGAAAAATETPAPARKAAG